MPKLVYKNYLLAILVVVAAFNYFDRFVFALALESIKHDLQLSDTQLGLMTGIAFGMFYAIAGLPIARWADRGNRVTITAAAVGILGLLVSLCGLVGNFIQLFLVRIGVAVGEAGAVPAGQSLLADYFDRSERPRAMAIYLMYYSISMISGFLIGGWLIESFGWRLTFMMIGAPGVLIAILVKLTLREPRLEQRTAVLYVEQPSLTETLKVLWRQRSFRHILFAFGVSYFFTLGVSQWKTVFFMRSHGMEAGELGAWLALVWGGFAVLGNYLGGYCASRFAARQERLQMRVVSLLFVINVLVSIMIYLSPNKYMALTFVAITAVVTTLVGGPVFAAIQSLVNDRMRSVAVALIFLFANIIGFGLGPLAMGILSDLLNPIFGQESLRYALVLFSPGGLWVAFHYWKAANTIEDDIRRVELEVKSKEGEKIKSNPSALHLNPEATTNLSKSSLN